MKRLFLFLCCTLASALFADTWTDPETNITWTYTLSNGKASLGGGSESTPAIPTTYAGALAIPSTINGSPVAGLNGYAFCDCDSLTSVVIPEGVTSIGTYAFRSCSSLTSVVIPEGVTSIGGRAFFDCSSLTSFSLPASVTSMPENALPPSSNNLKVLEVAPGNPLYSTENNILYTKGKTKILLVARGGIVGSLTLPSTLTSISGSAFAFCSSLTSVIIPEGVTAIGSRAFEGCSSLTSVVIPEGVTSIGTYAFHSCSSLTSVVIPEGVTSIGSNAFSGCSSLTSVVIPEGVTSIGSWAFHGCSSLTSVVIPEGVTSIEAEAFAFCSSLTSVVIPEGVTSIGICAFYDCSSLASVVIPEGVTSIGSSAFSSCSRLKEVTFLGDVPKGWEYIYPSENGKKIYFSQAYSGKWNAALSATQRGTILELISKAGVAVTAEMTMPKTMRITYSVESEQPTVKVRAVAWKDGVRSFANIVPVRTAAEGSPEAVPNGGEVATGEEHTFVWQVSADWATDLDKVAMEILVEEGTLLPQEKITIPALDDHPEMTITRNGLASGQLFDALVWCYAEGDEALVVTDGVVKIDGKVVVDGNMVANWDGTQGGCLPNGDLDWRTWYATTLLNYLYGKMGYKVLAGEDLTWARAATRLELADSGLDQVSVKITEE